MEIEKPHNEMNIINTTKIRRMQLLGHLIRMRDDRNAKDIFNGKLMGKKSMIRPRKIGLEDVEKYLP